MAEEAILAAVLGDTDLAEYAQVRLDYEQFSSPFLGKIYRSVCDLLDQGLAPDTAACMTGLEEAEVRQRTEPDFTVELEEVA